MMTIREFALLCACNTQTLRYYDRIGLLKPRRVDQWTGYRYYEKDQAMDFVKIKHLQSADFSIGEIKNLLIKPDREVYEAFDRKIAEQEQKLERIKQIQQSYLEEKNAMEKIMQGVTDFMLAQVKDYEILREFGLDPKDGEAILKKGCDHMTRRAKEQVFSDDSVRLVVDGEVYCGVGEVSEKIGLLAEDAVSKQLLIGVSDQEDPDPEKYETILEKHGWEHVYEFIDEIPSLKEPVLDMALKGAHIRVDAERDHIFRFQLANTALLKDMSFPLFLFGAVITKQGIDDVTMSCEAEPSEDGVNHFALMRRKHDITVSESYTDI